MTITTTDRLILHSMATTPMSERIKMKLKYIQDGCAHNVTREGICIVCNLKIK